MPRAWSPDSARPWRCCCEDEQGRSRLWISTLEVEKDKTEQPDIVELAPACHLVGMDFTSPPGTPSEPGTPDTASVCSHDEQGRTESLVELNTSKDEGQASLESFCASAPSGLQAPRKSTSTAHLLSTTACTRTTYLELISQQPEMPLGLEKAPSSSWCSKFLCMARSMHLTAVIAFVMIAESTLCLFPPAYVPGFGVADLLLPPIPYYLFLAAGIGIVTQFRQSYEDFTRANTGFARLVILRWTMYYIGIVLVRSLSQRFIEDVHWQLVLDFFFGAISLGTDILVSASLSLWRQTGSVRAASAALIRLVPTACYIVGVASMLLVNVFVFSGSSYLGFIVFAEKVVLRLFKVCVFHASPCGYPRWLLCMSVHFEIDIQIIASLALAWAQSPSVAAQQMLCDWLLFLNKCLALRSWDVDLTEEKVEVLPWFSRWRMKLSIRLAGVAVLFPQHYYMARCINDLLEGVAQSATLLATLVFLCCTAAGGASTDVYRQEFQHYFLGDDLRGVAFVGIMLCFSVSQDIIVQLVVASRGVTLHPFLHDVTQDWGHTLFYALKAGGASMWILFAAASLAWQRSVLCLAKGNCPDSTAF